MLRVCMQNAQFSFQLFDDGIDIHNIFNNLQQLGILMFIPISFNVNWSNSRNWIRAKHFFQSPFSQVHLSATSSDMGMDKHYFNKSIVGGSAIFTMGLWATKVTMAVSDTSGYGTYSITTIQEKHNK